ncbi:MAG: IS1 family transposase [bacterium]|nr:IS1 family transposase [bacterium]
MQKCPKCQSSEIRKDGFVRQKQRFKCKICNFHFTVQQIGKPLSKRRDAFILYLAGLDYRKIGSLLNTSHITIYNWLKDINVNLDQIRGDKLKVVQSEYIIKHLEQQNNKGTIKGLLLIEFTDEITNIMLAMKNK